jgi:hypothetical protein
MLSRCCMLVQAPGTDHTSGHVSPISVRNTSRTTRTMDRLRVTNNVFYRFSTDTANQRHSHAVAISFIGHAQNDGCPLIYAFRASKMLAKCASSPCNRPGAKNVHLYMPKLTCLNKAKAPSVDTANREAPGVCVEVEVSQTTLPTKREGRRRIRQRPGSPAISRQR